jgi:bilirubin oxidase
MKNIQLSKVFLTVITLFFAATFLTVTGASAQVAGGTLDPTTIQKYVDTLPVPKVMPKEGTIGNIDYYEIAVRQFKQQLLPGTFPKTTVWGYGSADDSSTFSYPARTIEARTNKPVRVKWINDLKNPVTKDFLPHLLPIDQTLHWANPPQDCFDAMSSMPGMQHPDCRGRSQEPYTGPVPIITHLHGAHVQPDSDGYPEAWYLPNADNIPAGYAIKGTNFDQIPGVGFTPGAAVFQYPNDQRATTLWYHDHVLGMTRANVYTGLAGFYLIRDSNTDPNGLPKGGFEIPLIIQDKSFNSDGSLFFPDNRAFFEGVDVADLQIPFIPETTLTGGISDVSPIWNPEFFGNTILVNGKTWPKMNVEQRRYRFRILNGNDTRVMILKIVADPLAERPVTPAVPFWQIGADGGFLPKPVKQDQLLVAGAERFDVIVDFTNVPKGTKLYVINEGPDEPFGGGVPGVDFPFSDPNTTGQVMQLTVVQRTSIDTSTKPQFLSLPSRTKLGKATKTRTVSLNEAESESVFVIFADGKIKESNSAQAVAFAPVEALLGIATVDANGVITPLRKEWMEPITEDPALNSTEIWEIYDFTEDAHPIHIHQVQFEVINRQDIAIAADGTATLVPGTITGPEAGETGTKDTVLVYPSKLTRVKAKFDIPGLFVWHCHILSHEDNEMMRPYCVGGGCMP